MVSICYVIQTAAEQGGMKAWTPPGHTHKKQHFGQEIIKKTHKHTKSKSCKLHSVRRCNRFCCSQAQYCKSKARFPLPEFTGRVDGP